MKNILILLILVSLASSGYAEDRQKINIAILDFRPQNISKIDSTIITGFFRTALVNTKHFKIIDKNNMDKILEEQGFQQTGCTEQSCAVEIGKILNVQQMIIGSVSKLENVYFIISDIVDVKTAQILDSARVKYENVDEIEIAINKLVKALIKKEKQKNIISLKRNVLIGIGYGIGNVTNSNIRVFLQYRDRGNFGFQINYENYKDIARSWDIGRFKYLFPIVLNLYGDYKSYTFYFGCGLFKLIDRGNSYIDFLLNAGCMLKLKGHLNLAIDIKCFGWPEIVYVETWEPKNDAIVISLSLAYKFEF